MSINKNLQDILCKNPEWEKIITQSEIELNKESVKDIKMPIYFLEDENTKELHYDFEEMANELENRICKTLNRNVLITISEVE